MIHQQDLSEILGPTGQIAALTRIMNSVPARFRWPRRWPQAMENATTCVWKPAPGTGKTLAYLLPCIFSGKRVIISTGTKNLQEQIFFKDLPFLEKALGRKLSVCYVKGRSNYLCLKKLAEIDGEGYLFSRHDPEYLEMIRDWARMTETGDRAELKTLPDDFILWHHLDARRETCTGQKCPDFEACFVTQVRQRALESDIVIVNHHLFFADLALRQGDFGSVLPDYSVVIFDEAHELEDIVTQYFGIMVSSYRLDEFARDAARSGRAGSPSTFLLDQIAKLRRLCRRVLSAPSAARRGASRCGNWATGWRCAAARSAATRRRNPTASCCLSCRSSRGTRKPADPKRCHRCALHGAARSCTTS